MQARDNVSVHKEDKSPRDVDYRPEIQSESSEKFHAASRAQRAMLHVE